MSFRQAVLIFLALTVAVALWGRRDGYTAHHLHFHCSTSR